MGCSRAAWVNRISHPAGNGSHGLACMVFPGSLDSQPLPGREGYGMVA
jgi:hypothetical protein